MADDIASLIKRLTPAQKSVLERRFDRPSLHSGRNGYPAPTMAVLARHGLATKGKVFLWETNWRLTALGIEIGRELSAQTRARLAEQDRKSEESKSPHSR
jgi:hypothetical protein